MIYIIDFFLIFFSYVFYVCLMLLKFNINLYTKRFNFFGYVFFLIMFFFWFIFFFRFLNLFREQTPNHISYFYYKLIQFDIISIIIFIVFMFMFLRFYIYFLKLAFFKVHYYLMNINNVLFYDLYISIIYFLVTWPNRFILYFIYKNITFFQVYRNYFYYLLKYFFIVIMFLVLIIDLIFNDFFLKYFTILLPWYSLYQLIYNINSFFFYKIEYLYDIIITNILYPCDYSESIFLYSEHSDDEYSVLREYINKKILY